MAVIPQAQITQDSGLIAKVAGAQNMMLRAKEMQIRQERHNMDKEKFGAELLTLDIAQQQAELNLKSARINLKETEGGLNARLMEMNNRELSLNQIDKVRRNETTQAEQARAELNELNEFLGKDDVPAIQKTSALDRYVAKHSNLATTELNPEIQAEMGSTIRQLGVKRNTIAGQVMQDVRTSADQMYAAMGAATSSTDLANMATHPAFAMARQDAKFMENYYSTQESLRKIELEEKKLQVAQLGEVSSLRKEFNALAGVKDFRTVDASFRKIIAGEAAGVESPAGDLSLIFNYMKLLDPGSVVRESEFATAAKAAPILQRVGISWDKVKAVWRGEKLVPTQRNDFRNQARNVFEAQARSVLPEIQQYAGLAGAMAGRVINPLDERIIAAAATGPDGITDLVAELSAPADRKNLVNSINPGDL